jgi:hypothetical protein
MLDGLLTWMLKGNAIREDELPTYHFRWSNPVRNTRITTPLPGVGQSQVWYVLLR